MTTPRADAALPEEAVVDLDRIAPVDLIVGIPCFDNAETVGGVVTAVEAGLRKHFPSLRSLICASDGGSTDGTLDAFRAGGVGGDAERLLVPPDTRPVEKAAFGYRGPKGKGSAVRAILEAARRLQVRACAIVDADLRSITPYWVDRLLAPIVDHGYEFAAPLYARHRHDGTITNAVAYPLTTSLYGSRIRQPIGGEFAFSGALAERYAGDTWEGEVARFGIDVWLTTAAVAEERRVCQTRLGAKLHDPKDPGKDLGPMFREVVGTLFSLGRRYDDRWLAVEGATAPPTLGFPAEYAADPVEVSLDELARGFARGRDRHADTWDDVLAPDNAATIAALDPSEPELAPERWVRILFDYLVAARSTDDLPALVDTMVPLYFARTATFVRDTLDVTDDEAEALVERVVDVAVAEKPYLRDRWTAAVVPSR
ncbi:MAG TPA: glycosyl transferase family 2 [Actinomycetota bacterium]|nr:glycosyl transferase family 2 [Actinomycetota bacterium]